MPKEDSSEDITDHSNQDNPSSSGNTTADKVDDELTGKNEFPDSCYEEMKLSELASGLNSQLKTVKTSAENAADKAKLGQPDLRNVVVIEANAASDFVGDTAVANLADTLDKIKDLDGVFEEVLNKAEGWDVSINIKRNK